MKRALCAALLCACVFVPAGATQAAEETKLDKQRLAFKARINGIACANTLDHAAMQWVKNSADLHKFDPADPLMWSMLAAYRLRAIELDDSYRSGEVVEQDAQRGVSLGPNLWETHWTLAMVRIHQHRHALAGQLIEKARGLGADATAIAFIQWQMAIERQMPKAAEEALLPVKSMGTRGYMAGELIAASLGTALLMQGRTREAVAAFKDAEGRSGFPGECHFSALHGQATTLLLHDGNAAAAAPVIERGEGMADRGEMYRLKSLLPYVRWLNGGALEHAPLTPDEAALDLVKWPVGARLIPKLVQEKRLKDIEARDGQGNSLLILAAAANRPDVADVLVRAGANVDRANRQGQRSIGHFAAFGNEAGIRMLLAAKAQVNYRDRQSNSPLSAAVTGCNARVLEMLLTAAGAAAKPELDALLVSAAYQGQLECAKSLLAAGARVNGGNGKTMPPLIAAIISANREMVRWLLGNKADPQLKFMGRNAFDFVRESPDPEIRRLVAGQGAA